MSVRKSQSLRISRSSFGQSFTDDINCDEASLRRFAEIYYRSPTDNNYELMTLSVRRQIKHVAVQTTPDIDERHYSWLLNMESKADALCVDMSNLLNALMHAKNWDIKRKRFEQNPLSLDFILNKTSADAKKRTIKPELDLPEFSTSSLFTASSNLSVTLVINNIENKIKTVLKRATELKNSIPIVSIENVKETSDKSIQTISPELKNSKTEDNRLELNRENWVRSRVPNQNKIKNDPLCTEKPVAIKLQRSTTQMSFANSKNAGMLKKQVSSLNSDWKKKDFNISKTSSNFAAKKVLSNENVPGSDMSATGAIPKKTKDLRVNVPVTIHKKTDRDFAESSKTKQVSFQKPVWR